MRVLRVLSVLCLAVLFHPATGNARQQATGTVQGVVLDQSGAVVPGAELTLRNVATNVAATQPSND